MLKNTQSVLDILINILPNKKNIISNKDHISANSAEKIIFYLAKREKMK